MASLSAVVAGLLRRSSYENWIGDYGEVGSLRRFYIIDRIPQL